MEFVDHGSLANTRVPGHEDELRRTAGHDPLESGLQGFGFDTSSIQPLRNQKPVGGILFAKHEGFDAADRHPFGQTTAEIGVESAGALVAVLGGLSQQLHHDRRERLRKTRHSVAG